jgi:hypothetical protein
LLGGIELESSSEGNFVDGLLKSLGVSKFRVVEHQRLENSLDRSFQKIIDRIRQ